ncbi:MAG: hypothetical protein AAGA48_33550 [Myxococcota bacterium]
MSPLALAMTIWFVICAPLLMLLWAERRRTDDELAAYLDEANGRAEYALFFLAVQGILVVQDYEWRGLATLAAGSFVAVVPLVTWTIAWVGRFAW